MFAQASLISVAVLALASVSNAQSDDATFDQIATVQLTFPAAGLSPNPIPNEWLNIQGLLDVSFGDVDVKSLGQQLTTDQVHEDPTFRISSQTKKSEKDKVFDDDKTFTIAFIDGGVAGKAPKNQFCHYLANNLSVGNRGVFNNKTEAVIAYGGPYPAENDGPHRYMQLVFEQFNNFTAPASPARGSGLQNISIADYHKAANGGLGKIVAASYIQVERGNANAPSSTAPVNQASVTALASSLSASAAGSAVPTQSNHSSGHNGALSLNAAPLVGVAGMVSAAIFGALLF